MFISISWRSLPSFVFLLSSLLYTPLSLDGYFISHLISLHVFLLDLRLLGMIHPLNQSAGGGLMPQTEEETV